MMAIGIMLLFVLLLLVSVPISATLSAVSLAPSLMDPNFHISAEYIIRAMLGGIDSFPLLAVPMFVLSGILMAKGGVSKKLFDVFSYFLGEHTAGMPCHCDLFVLRRYFRQCTGNCGRSGKHDDSTADPHGL